jgi:serine/threonine protein phosphatase 1
MSELGEPGGPARVYVIGDIHGRSDLLDSIIAQIHHDVQAHPVEPCLTVTLGDYVDRGADSRGVIDRLSRNPFPSDYVALKGNHEDMYLTSLREPSTIGHWRRQGGLETLHSYGVPVRAVMEGREFEQASRAFAAAVPNEHLAFLASLKTSLPLGRYFLCHAGVRPGVPLNAQREEDLLWIRNEFLSSGENFGKIVVHGHTPVEEPQVLRNRINIDTGAFLTGRLTCLVLEGRYYRFLTTK